MAEYKLTIVKTSDYGSSLRTKGVLSRIPDGTSWDRIPQTIEIEVPAGTRPGVIYDVTITERSSGNT